MRVALPAIAGVAVLAACASFGVDDTANPTPPADAGGDGAPAVPGTFCPVVGAVFCSDFEQGGLTAEWLPEMTPVHFLTLDSVGGEHAHALRGTLDSGSKAITARETLEKLIGAPTRATYAFDILVDQSDPSAIVEMASLATIDATSTLAFHITLEKGSFGFAEYSRGGNPAYKVTELIPIDAKWHRFEVTAVFRPTVRVTVRVDGASPQIDRDTAVKPAFPPPTQLQVIAGVANINTVSGKLRYAIDNLTVFEQ